MTHYIHITAGTEDSDADYTFECTEVTSACECWTECRECEPTEQQDEDGEGESHGVFHQFIGGDFWGVASGKCGLKLCDVNIDPFYHLLYESRWCPPDQRRLPSGRYEIYIEDWDDMSILVNLVSEEPR